MVYTYIQVGEDLWRLANETDAGQVMAVWKRRIVSLARLLIPGVVVLSFAYGVYRLLPIVVSEVPAAIFGSALAIAATHWFQRRQAIEAAQRQQKIEAYSGFLSIIFSDIVPPVHQGLAEGKPPDISSNDINDKMLSMSAQIGLWAGDDVLRQYNDLLHNAMKPADPDRAEDILDDIGVFILKVRKDLGYRNVKLTARGLRPLFGIPRQEFVKPTNARPAEAAPASVSTPVPQSPMPAPAHLDQAPSRARRRSRGRPAQ